MKTTSKRTSTSRRRSPRPRARSSLARALLAWSTLARRQKLRWYLFGAQAVAVYGVPRTTADVDITVDLGKSSLRELLAQLDRAGFSPEIDDAAFIRDTRVLPIVHRPTGWKLDIVLAGPGLEHEFLDAARTFKIGDHAIPVIAPEHLVALKVLAGRPKDLEDIRGLVRIADLDHARVVETLEVLEAALGQSDLIALYRRLRREAKTR